MKRIEALKIILAWWAYANTWLPLEEALDWALNAHPDYRIPQASLVWFGTVNPPSPNKVLLIKVWGDVIKATISPNMPKYMLGQESLEDLITETIL